MHGTQTLLKMEAEGVVTLETDERISIRRTDRRTFQLRIQQVKSTDSGLYNCTVQEWIQDPYGIWYSLDTKSETMELDVFEKGMLQTALHFCLITPQLYATTDQYIRKLSHIHLCAGQVANLTNGHGKSIEFIRLYNKW